MSIIDPFVGIDDMMNRKVYGVVVGIITNNKDPEKLGRVKLKIPIRECPNETDWVRIATLMTGKEMGSFFLPEVGDEVLVAFAQGEVSCPYVIGSLWNSQEKPPLTNEDGKNNIRKFKSRNGNEIIFGDEENKEKITIKTKKGQTILMEDESNGKIQIKEQNEKNMLVIDGGKNEVTITGDMKITIQSKSCNIKIDSSQNNITIESPMQLKIKGQMIDIEAAATMNLKSDGIINIKGSMVKIN